MRDSYLYDDVDILQNLANIKDHDLFSRTKADITNLSMLAIYNRSYRIFAYAILGCSLNKDGVSDTVASKYEGIGEYKGKDYMERPHEHVKGNYNWNYKE